MSVRVISRRSLLFLLQGAAGDLHSQSNEYGRCEYICNASALVGFFSWKCYNAFDLIITESEELFV